MRALLCLSLHGVLPEPRRTRRFSDARDDRALDVHAVKAALDDLEDFEAKVPWRDPLLIHFALCCLRGCCLHSFSEYSVDKYSITGMTVFWYSVTVFILISTQ